MESKRKIAIVTGSNKGIGFEIVKGLCKDFDGIVFLTSRNVENGHKAVEELKGLGFEAKYHQLDIENLESIDNFAKYLKDNYGGIDILVNNAAILIEDSEGISIEKIAVDTMNINFFGTLNVCKALFPLLRNNARVVNVSSRLGLLNRVSNKSIKDKIRSKDLTTDDIIQIVNEYVEACKTDKHKTMGYPSRDYSQAYSMSKVALTALTKVQQKDFDADTSRSGIIVSSVCPGYCKTSMTKGGGLLSATQGAETPIYLALLPENFTGSKGAFWGEKNELDFENGGMVMQSLGMLKKKIFG